MGNFLLGFGVGVTVGVLFAPKSGQETREFVSSKAGQGADYLSQQGQTLKDSASDLLERGKQAVMSQKDKVESAVSNATNQGNKGSQGHQGHPSFQG
jgi:gas vesicle protein